MAVSNRKRLVFLIALWRYRQTLHMLGIYKPFPYDPRRPKEQGGGSAGSIGTVADSLAWFQRQKDSGSTAWYNLCEKACRTSYQLPGMYDSAELHSRSIPSNFRHGQETPSAGDLVMYENGGYGHITVATGEGWTVWTNDYSGKGKISKADARDLVSWCSANKWFVADAWWKSNIYRETHEQDGDDDMPLTDADVEKIWASKTDDPVTGDRVSMRELLKRARTNASQAADVELTWADKTEDPVTNEKISMRELLKRTRTNAKQAAEKE